MPSPVVPIEIRDSENGDALVRSGVVAAFFLEPFIDEASEALSTVFDRFVATVPTGELRWAMPSATSEHWKKVDEKLLDRMRSSLTPAASTGKKSRKRRFTAFTINDSGEHAPQYSLTISDRDAAEDGAASRTLLQMTFPLSAAETGSVETLVSLVEETTTRLKPAYGYVSPALLPAEGSRQAAFARMRPITMRHPGYDVPMNELAQLDIGARTRGARWITLLGPALLQQLGGLDSLRRFASSELELRDLGGTALLRAGKTPEIGDTEQGIPTPGLRSLARVLEPVTLFGEVNLLSYFAAFDEGVLRAWERRFLDP
ncbi:MAG TPA: type VI immunity family protein [Polyangiaceae bacterium]|nr:type VI immunity family protein [Polyangiaceae bacterium]